MEGVVQALSAVIDAASFSSHDKQQLLSLVQSKQTEQDADDASFDAEEATLGAPAAASYKTHSGGILDVLGDLKLKAEAELSALRKAEMNEAHNFGMLKTSLEDQMAADSKNLGEEKASLASNEGTKATAEADLANTEQDLADANGALATAQSTCMSVAADHEATVKSRTEELAAIATARKILEE